MNRSVLTIVLVLAGIIAYSCAGSEDSITVYSGRTENLIGPLIEQFTETTGIDVEVRYGQSADLALLIHEEGDRSPADVFISQSPGAIGFLAERGRLRPIGHDTLALLPAEFRNAGGMWAGMSGRVRVVVYNRDLVGAARFGIRTNGGTVPGTGCGGAGQWLLPGLRHGDAGDPR